MKRKASVIRLLAGCAVLLLSACASHRPPMCKGPFTPINQPLTVASRDPQR